MDLLLFVIAIVFALVMFVGGYVSGWENAKLDSRYEINARRRI